MPWKCQEGIWPAVLSALLQAIGLPNPTVLAEKDQTAMDKLWTAMDKPLPIRFMLWEKILWSLQTCQVLRYVV